eukprot:1139377-Pelagomonas_calceolata.AAC.1
MDYMIYSSQKNFVTGDATMNASFMLSPPLINKSLGYLSLWVGGWLEVALNAVCGVTAVPCCGLWSWLAAQAGCVRKCQVEDIGAGVVPE